MRRLASLGGIAALLATGLGARTAGAAPTLRVQFSQHGDMTWIGNTLAQECAGTARAPVVGTVGACGNSTGDSAPDRTTMDRNLYSRKRRPRYPTRGCVKNTEPAESSRTAMATSSMSGRDNRRPRIAPHTSSARLMAIAQRRDSRRVVQTASTTCMTSPSVMPG